MKRLLSLVAALATLVFAAGARADADSATHYYLSLGDSLAAGTNAAGDGAAFTNLGYADQLHASLVADDPKLELVKLGCPGESAGSMRSGSQPSSVVLSCGSPRYYKNVLYPKGTQLGEAVSFLEAHKAKVALITIDIGANDIQHVDAQGNPVVCLFPPEDCDAETPALAQNLGAILGELRAAVGPDVANAFVRDPDRTLANGSWKRLQGHFRAPKNVDTASTRPLDAALPLTAAHPRLRPLSQGLRLGVDAQPIVRALRCADSYARVGAV
jgi:hypothetical protein